MIYIIDFYNKIVNNILHFFPAAILLALVLTLLYGRVLRKDNRVSFFFFCIYFVLLTGETLWGRLGMDIATEDFIGIRQLFENPWYMAATVDNVIMFMPFGFLAVRVITSAKPRQKCLIAALVTSGCIELLQYVLRIGEAQLVDILANFLGAAAGSLFRKRSGD